MLYTGKAEKGSHPQGSALKAEHVAVTGLYGVPWPNGKVVQITHSVSGGVSVLSEEIVQGIL